YEYLMDSETDNIEGWEQFLHVPDLSAEKAARRAQESAIAQAKQRLREEGLLLLEQAGRGEHIYRESPCFFADPQGQGFLVCWANGQMPGSRPLLRHGPPWSAGPQPTGIDLESTVWRLGASPSGRYLAAGHASGAWKAQVWDLEQKALVLEVAHTQAVDWADFTADEALFVSRSSEEVIVTALASRSQRATYRVPGHGSHAALPPSGTKLVVDLQVNLGILDLNSGQLKSPLCLGVRQDFTALTSWQGQKLQATFAAFDFTKMGEQLKETLRQMGLDEAEI